jgi:enoyl-CoA hydratase/carnithine racemase
MLLEAAVLPAAEMKARGFLNRVVADGDVPAHAFASAQRIASLSPQAARLNKGTLRALTAGSGAHNAYGYADSDEHREGIGAFLEKRKPAF